MTRRLGDGTIGPVHVDEYAKGPVDSDDPESGLDGPVGVGEEREHQLPPASERSRTSRAVAGSTAGTGECRAPKRAWSAR
jgi:hypothetical protein